MKNEAVGMIDLGRMTEEQKEQHYLNVCQGAGLPPELGLLKYTMMESGTADSPRRLVLYATKGATDKIRDIHGIDVTDLSHAIVAGAVVFTVKGQNAKGRKDIAVGAAAIEGKHGKNLENAFALAQTRATRRLTLQFSGLGILDESEVQDANGTVSIADAPVPLSEIGQPATISAAPGADITKMDLKEALAAATAPAPPARIPNPAVGLSLMPAGTMDGPNGVVPQVAIKTAVEAVKPTPAPPVSGDPGDPAVPAPPVSGDPVVSIAVEETANPARKKRRTKAEMEAARAATTQDPTPEPVAIPVVQVAQRVDTPAPVSDSTTSAATPIISPALASAPAPETESVPTMTVVGDLPNAEQAKAFVAKLNEYKQNVLPKGGMTPSHGMGVHSKLRKFISVACNGNDNLQALTVNQWTSVFNLMDKVLQEQGERKLVEFIEQNIGVTNEPVTA